MLEYIVISVDSWQYPIDFIAIQPKTCLGGHPLILERPWLATIDAYVRCKSGCMNILDGHNTKDLVLYPIVKPSFESEDPPKSEYELEEIDACLVLPISKVLQLKNENEYDVINNFISDPYVVTYCTNQLINVAIEKSREEYFLMSLLHMIYP